MADLKTTTTRSAKLYTLADPRTGKVRYGGQTLMPTKMRITDHVCQARYAYRRDAKSKWIRSLLAVGLRPLMRVVAIVEAENIASVENGYIAILRARGCDLLNSLDWCREHTVDGIRVIRPE